jgi:hypothetical protein
VFSEILYGFLYEYLTTAIICYFVKLNSCLVILLSRNANAIFQAVEEP